MALVGLQYEPMSFDVQEVCFDEEQNILDTREKSRKSQSVTEWCRCGKCRVMDKNIKCLSCVEIEICDICNYRLQDTIIGMR